jgi:hypothetical protein
MSDVYGPVVIGDGGITCPRCGMTSHNPNDIAEGYCGNCHDWTGPVLPTYEVADHLGRMVPMGFIWDGRCFEFTEHGTVEVEGWSGDLGNGLSYDIRGGDWDPEWDFEL